MTRTAIGHTLSAFAAVALVSALASSPASSQSPELEGQRSQSTGMKGAAITSAALSGFSNRHNTPKGLATKKQKGFTKKPDTNPVGMRDEVFRTNDKVMTLR
jgi:hypothetical protein